MPRLLRTLIPRIKQSILARGLIRTLLRAPRLPINFIREWNIAKTLAKETSRSEFDLQYGVDTDGDLGGASIGRTYLSDLDIPSAN